MTTEAVLEKRVQKLKHRLRKVRDTGEEAAPLPLVRKIRKRLKHNQRKLRARMAMRDKTAAQKESAEPKTG